MRSFIIVFLFLLAFGSAIADDNQPQTKIQTVASPKLRADVLSSIGTYEAATGGNSNPTLISAEPVQINGKTYIEKWTLQSNEQTVQYQVELTASPRGGVDFGIGKIK